MDIKREQNTIRRNEHSSNRNCLVFHTETIFFASSILSILLDFRCCSGKNVSFRFQRVSDIFVCAWQHLSVRRWHFGLLARFALSLSLPYRRHCSSNCVLTEKNNLKIVDSISTIDGLNTINANRRIIEKNLRDWLVALSYNQILWLYFKVSIANSSCVYLNIN